MTERGDTWYSVGYKKPSPQAQFKPGQSGNPKGRPKGAKNFATELEEEMCSPIQITENGKPKRISKRRAMIRIACNKSLAGDMKATTLVFNKATLLDTQNDANSSVAAKDMWDSAEDQRVMESIVRRIRQPERELPREQSFPPAQSKEGDI